MLILLKKLKGSLEKRNLERNLQNTAQHTCLEKQTPTKSKVYQGLTEGL